MVKKKPAAKSPLDEIGYTGAMEGDVASLRRFIRYLGDRLSDVSLLGPLARHRNAELSGRLRSLSAEARRMGDFLDGFVVAMPKKRKHR